MKVLSIPFIENYYTDYLNSLKAKRVSLGPKELQERYEFYLEGAQNTLSIINGVKPEEIPEALDMLKRNIELLRGKSVERKIDLTLSEGDARILKEFLQNPLIEGTLESAENSHFRERLFNTITDTLKKID